MTLTEPEYPQKVYSLLSDPDFREFLRLSFKEVGGDLEEFKENIECLGKKTNEYIDILYLVASKTE
jgi:hypothetical protein